MMNERQVSWTNETEYHSYYNLRILGYVDLACCIFAVISNLLVIMVFTRKSIISSMNTIFTHIAITESLAFISYTPHVWHEFFRVTKCFIPEHRTHHWELISLHSLGGAYLFRNISIWMAVMLAVWRYIAVVHPLKERIWCNVEITRKMIITGYIFVTSICIPPYFCIAVGATEKLLDEQGCLTTNYTAGEKTTIYEFQVPLEKIPFLYPIVFGGYAVVLKIFPSLVISIVSYKLIVTLIEAKKRRRNMVLISHCNRKIQTDQRTTQILLVILILFVIGETPNGIVSLITVYHGPEYFWNYFYYTMEIFNSVTHVTQCFNFLVYYYMSNQFRDIFKSFHMFKFYKKSSKDGDRILNQSWNASSQGSISIIHTCN